MRYRDKKLAQDIIWSYLWGTQAQKGYLDKKQTDVIFLL